jgi:hypothetical protein
MSENEEEELPEGWGQSNRRKKTLFALAFTKAKVNVADENDETPLWLAIRAEPKDPAVALVIAEILLKKGADPNRPHIIDGRPVPLLVFCRTDEMRALLQKHGGKFPPGFLKR